MRWNGEEEKETTCAEKNGDSLFHDSLLDERRPQELPRSSLAILRKFR
jgi:hypothetical protein